jgi:glycosyltransferase involved in cell wall biosynthesis
MTPVVLRKTATALRLLRRAVAHRALPIRPWRPGSSPRTLIVSGGAGAPFQYRVAHQLEELAQSDLAFAAFDQHYARLHRQLEQAQLLYLYRPAATPAMHQFIDQAQARRIPVIYDTDDLIWDERLIEYCDLKQVHGAAAIPAFLAEFHRSKALMQRADAFVASTEYLAGLLRASFGKPAYANRNAVSQRMIEQSARLFERVQQRSHDHVVIGYFSGWPKAHEPDLAVALPGLLRALDEETHARLRIVGHFDVMALPEQVRARVETVPFQPFDQLLDAIAAVDINLAPIVDNPHRRAKSAVKMLEAALVGVPTVASDLEPYQLIRRGESGMLAADDAGWRRAILALVRDAELRKRMGAAARAQVLRDETSAARAPHFAALLGELASIDYNQRRL